MFPVKQLDNKIERANEVEPILSKKIRVNIRPLWSEARLSNNQDVAFDLGLNPNTVSSYKNGNIQNPKIAVLIKFRDYFEEKLGRKIILEDLLEIEEIKEEDKS